MCDHIAVMTHVVGQEDPVCPHLAKPDRAVQAVVPRPQVSRTGGAEDGPHLSPQLGRVQTPGTPALEHPVTGNLLPPEDVGEEVRDVLDGDLLPRLDVHLSPQSDGVVLAEHDPGVTETGVGGEGEGRVERLAGDGRAPPRLLHVDGVCLDEADGSVDLLRRVDSLQAALSRRDQPVDDVLLDAVPGLPLLLQLLQVVHEQLQLLPSDGVLIPHPEEPEDGDEVGSGGGVSGDLDSLTQLGEVVTLPGGVAGPLTLALREVIKVRKKKK